MADVIEYQKCWLCINPVMGCPLGCAYCILENRNFEGVRVVSSALDAVNALTANRYFIPHVTPLTVNNYTDPFLKNSRLTTLEILESLDEMGYRNPISVITRCEISASDVSRLKQLKSLRLFVFVSFSGLPKNIEPAPFRWKLRTLERVALAGISLIHYWRPLIRGYNTSQRELSKVLDTVSQYTPISVMSGLKLSPPVRKKIESVIKLPDEEWHPDCKVVRDDIFENIESIQALHHPSHILFRKTSCAVSYLLGQADFNGNYVNPTEYNCSSCDNYRNCSTHAVTPELVEKACKAFEISNEFSIAERVVRVKGSLTLDQRTALRHALRMRVQSDSTEFPTHYRGEAFPLDANQKLKT